MASYKAASLSVFLCLLDYETLFQIERPGLGWTNDITLPLAAVRQMPAYFNRRHDLLLLFLPYRGRDVVADIEQSSAIPFFKDQP